MKAFWRRVHRDQKRKPLSPENRKAHRDRVWAIKRRVADHSGHVRLVTVSGQHLTAKRDIRREAERAGLAPSGRQWRKLRKQMARDERTQREQKAAA